MNRNCRRKTEKVYVKVTSDFDATGYMQPRQITWGDGRTYPIEQVRDFRPGNVNSKCEKNIKKYNQASRANSSRHSANTISEVFQPNISRG